MATSGHFPQWLFYGDTYNWVPYDSDSNAKLENAFQTGTNIVSLSGRTHTYSVDLVAMMQKNTRYGTERRIHRDTTGTMLVPSHLVSVPHGTRMSFSVATSSGGFPSRIPMNQFHSPIYSTSVPPKSGPTGSMASSPLAGHTGTMPVPLTYGGTSSPLNAFPTTFSFPTVPIKSGTKTGTKFDSPPTPDPISADTSPSMPKKKSKPEPTNQFGFYDKFFRKHTDLKMPESIPKDETCPICITSLLEPADIDVPTKSHSSKLPHDTVCALQKCSHLFHVVCIGTMLDSMGNMKLNEHSLSCPICQTIHGVKTGDQPVTGTMNTRVEGYSVPGHEGHQTIVIRYHFSDGMSETGTMYKAAGFPRVCYIPDSPEGRIVLQLLRLAWKRRLIFTIGTSVTTGRQNCIVWNNIHHKTEPHSNTSGHGFPDPNFLKNIKMELGVQGVTEDEL